MRKFNCIENFNKMHVIIFSNMRFRIRSLNLNLINLLLMISIFHLSLSSAMDTITSGQFIRDHDTINSENSDFKLGFFSPQNPTNRYVGIWYLSESNIIWVANRNQPLVDASGTVTISNNGNLVILDKQNMSVWSSNISNIATNSTVKILNTGNLALSDGKTGTTIWESFQDPSDIMVPKMKLSINKRTGEKVKLTSWRSSSDPSLGYYSASLEHPDAPDFFLWFNGTRPYGRTGPWNGRIFLGSPTMSTGWSVGHEDDGNVYVTYNLENNADFAVMGLSPLGQLWIAGWNNRREVLRQVINGTFCDLYGVCGAFGSCSSQGSPICSCLNGYEPKNLEQWNRQNWTSGCVRKKPLQCAGVADKQDGFVKLENMKVPDFLERSTSVTEDNCRTECLNNCTSVAYAFDLNGIGCMQWGGDLIDIQRFSSGGVHLCIRVSLSENGNAEKHSRKRTIIIAITVTMGIITLAACACFLWRLTAKYADVILDLGQTDPHSQPQRMISQDEEVKMDELPLFNFEDLVIATKNFHSSNKLGHGGFGLVYKGQLRDGQQIAIKRLSKASRQGQEEFMNEVVVISKLQHRNLVRLLGCCIQQAERILIYEYMHNKSLDAILFDSIRKKELDWQKRFKIIEGISRGLLYLHRYSRIKIIHRDLKVSNILLDEELNPKISDFGLAKIFRSNEDQANTRRVVGTYYISPEYAMQGLFSEKSDVFSFGVLVLEIVSGRSSCRLYNMERGSQTLLGYVWRLWNESNLVSFIDSEIQYQGSYEDILRCIHIGLLCVQESAKERPTMANVVSMLSSEIDNLPIPRQPAYILNEMGFNHESTLETLGLHSAKFVSITDFSGR